MRAPNRALAERTSPPSPEGICLAYIGRQEPEGQARSRGPKRRWTIPPPPALSAVGLEGAAILDEVPGPLGLELWQRFRDAVAWSGIPATERISGLGSASSYLDSDEFRRAAKGEPALARPLGVLAALHHGRLTNARVAAKAASVFAEWAASRGFDETAALFSGLAARMRPRDPDLAFAAGRAERRCSRYPVAVEWFTRAVGLARRAGDDAAYASAYLGWGLLEEQRGDRAAARKRYERARKAAMRGSLHQLAAAAEHNMIALSVPYDTFDVGFAHVVAAYKLYDESEAERLALLALDAGVFLAEHGYYAPAMLLYDASLPHQARPAVLTALQANVARAAAALGERDRFQAAFDLLMREDALSGEFAPASLAELARAAHTLGLDGKAAGLASEAIKIARERGAVAAERAATKALEVVREHGPGDVPQEPPARVIRFAKRFAKRLSALPASRP